jgi:SAM-dependent methyltransferase
MNTADIDPFFNGSQVYGDDFDQEQIRQWYLEEESGYYDLAQTYKESVYGYHELNRYHGFRFLKERYPTCLAFGCSTGEDVEPLADRIDRFVCIEPAEKWWRDSIGGKPAQYMKPEVDGSIPLPCSSVDLVTSLAVLHHVPNVSYVISELCRVIKPGGSLIVREPICTMGDWRRPRRGLTKNERGFPPGWLEGRVKENGVALVRKDYCGFPLTVRLGNALHVRAYNSPALVRLDAILSESTRVNLHYHRDMAFKKIAPIHAFYVFQRNHSHD